MELIEPLERLAQQNKSGLAFLVAYGLSWSVCGVIWLRLKERTAAYTTLFQGLVAMPVALALSVAIGAIGVQRPVPEEITQLSVLVGVSQLLGLPFLIYLVVKKRHNLVPIAFAGITSMHFVLYSWLYRTPIYIVMAALISIGTMVVMLASGESKPRVGPAGVCFVTGGLLLLTALVFAVGHFVLGS